MRFVDEAFIKIKAGHGGRGAVSFRREKFIPYGGPDGGDGGKGADIYLVGAAGINTLADFRYNRSFKGPVGESGGSQGCTGAGGTDLEIVVPVGTVVTDVETQEQLGDVLQVGQRLLVAKGGNGGWGNNRFKSSTNRTPRKFMPGLPGEERELKLEMRVMADVGLLGLPNAGKSTLIRAVSAAKPKVADYPFTTLHPNLGVVFVGEHRSFVMADIPGVIEGAAEGAGLGLQFLKHLQRTGVLLHLVDIAPPDPEADPVEDTQAIAQELKKFSPELATKERWLVLNKLDLMPADEAEKRCKDILRRLRWKGPVFEISGLARQGTDKLCQAIMTRLEQIRHDKAEQDALKASRSRVAVAAAASAEKAAAAASAKPASTAWEKAVQARKKVTPKAEVVTRKAEKTSLKKAAAKGAGTKKAPAKKAKPAKATRKGAKAKVARPRAKTKSR